MSERWGMFKRIARHFGQKMNAEEKEIYREEYDKAFKEESEKEIRAKARRDALAKAKRRFKE